MFIRPVVLVFLLALLFMLPGCSSSRQGASAESRVATYRSAKHELLSARFDLARDRVAVRLADGRTWDLPHAISASGSRYAAGGVEFWEHQGSAVLRIGEEVVFDGGRVESDSR